MFTIQLLGPVTIEEDGVQVRKLGSQKSIAMLAYLIGHRQAVSRIRLADLLWGDKSESTGRGNVRWSLNYLAKLLPDCLTGERETIQFEPNSKVIVDVLKFDILRNKPEFDSQAQALECYQGEFMAGFFLDDSPEFEHWVVQERVARQNQVVHVIENLITYYTQFDQSYHVSQLIEQLLDLEPWREDMHRHMMYVLASKGMRGQALKHFETCRSILETEFQVSPEKNTLELYEHIRAGKDITLYNEFPVIRMAQPIAISTTHRPTLPIQPIRCIGRETELDKLTQLIQDGCRLLTLTGQGGIGKTRLAIELAHRLEDIFKDNIYFVALTGATNPAEIPQIIASSIGYTYSSSINIMEQLLQFFAEKHCLLVLDNFEHLIDGTNLLNTFLTQVEGLQFIVSSRIRTNLRAEYVHEVRELDFRVTNSPKEVAAVTLFMTHMERIVSEYALSEADQVAINKICELTRGVPLAIELAASWLNSLTLTEIASELAYSIDLLEQNRADIPEHQRSIRATFEYTWRLLSSSEQTSLAKLVIFQGGFTRHAAQYVAEINLRILSNLINKSILRHDVQYGRYSMHELYREFLAEKLSALGDVNSLHQRHAEYYSNMLRQHHDDLYSTDLPEVLDTLTVEIYNIQQAWDWAQRNGAWNIIDDALHPLGRYYQVRGLVQDGVASFELTLHYLAEANNKLLTARLYQEYTVLLAELGETEKAIEFSHQLIDIAQRLKQKPLEITGYLNLGKALWYEGDVKSAQRYLEKALALDENRRLVSVHHKRLEIMRMLAMVASRMADYERALQYYNRCLVDEGYLIDTFFQGQILRSLGSIYRNLGDYHLAEEHYTLALNTYRAIKNPQGEAAALNGLGDVAFYQFRYRQALEHYHKCLAIAQKMGDKRGEALILNNIGTVLQSLGVYDSAEIYFEQSIEIKEAINFQREIGWSQCCLGLLHHQRGNDYQAFQLCTQANKTFHELGDVLGQCISVLYLGHIELAYRREEQAIEKYQRVISMREEFNQPHLAIDAKAGLAQAFLQKNRIHDALAIVESILAFLRQRGAFYGSYEPFRIYYTCILVLQATTDNRASTLLNKAQQALREQASQIDDPNLQDTFLSEIDIHRRLLTAKTTLIGLI